MKYIKALNFKCDPSKAVSNLTPDVWDKYPFRTANESSPHREVSDIWVRYNDINNYGPEFNNPHESVWYEISEKMPDIVSLVYHFVDANNLCNLGGVLITKIPAGKQVYPHSDHGWHAEHYDKFAILLKGNNEQSFCYEDGEFKCSAGESWTFNNQAVHWVKNPTDEDRITLIICAKRRGNNSALGV